MNVKIGLLQLECKVGDVSHNMRKIESGVAEAARAGAELVVLPECAFTGPLHEHLDFVDNKGVYVAEAQRLARESHSAHPRN